MGLGRKGLAGHLIPRTQPRCVDARSEERQDGLVHRAVLLFRGQEHLVPVLNVSARGTMIAADLEPRIGEAVAVQFEGCTRIQAFVRWVRDGRIGLNFGHEIILG
jgi:hypothetical protein